MGFGLWGPGGKWGNLWQKVLKDQVEREKWVKLREQATYNPLDVMSRTTPGFEQTISPTGSQALIDAINQQYQGESGRRTRRALTSLQASGDVLPGGYGTAAMLANLGAGSDLSRSLAAARAGSIESNLGRLYGFGTGNIGWVRDQAMREQEFERNKALANIQASAAKKGRGMGVSLGFGPASISFQHGGTLPRRGVSLVGENGPELAVSDSGDTTIVPTNPEDLRIALIKQILSTTDVTPPAPQRRAPRAMPPAYAPKGVLERLGSLSRNLQIGVGPQAAGSTKLLALLAGGLMAGGESRLRGREMDRAAEQKAIEEQNRYDEQEYQKQLGEYGQQTGEARRMALAELLRPTPKAPAERMVPIETDSGTVWTPASQAAGKRVPKPTSRTNPIAAWNQLNTAMRTDPNISKFNEVRFGYQMVKQAAASGTPQSDMAMVYGFMKMLDPTSVVREGEYATAENTRGVPEMVRGQYNKLLKGQRLTPEQRQGFLDQASSVLDESKALRDISLARFRRAAATFGIEPSGLFEDQTPQDSGAEDEYQRYLKVLEGR